MPKKYLQEDGTYPDKKPHTPTTDEEAKRVLPKAAHPLYDSFRNEDMSIIEALNQTNQMIYFDPPPKLWKE